MNLSLLDAIRSLGGEDQVLRILGDSYEGIEWVGDPIYTKEQLEEELSRLRSESDLYEYQRLRAVEYPPIQDQLDALYHAGLFPEEMANKIKAVKDKYPKPNSL